MTKKLMSRRLIGWLLSPLLLLGAAGAWLALDPGFRWGRQLSNVAADMPKDEFELRVRDYLMGHPDVIMQAVNQLEQRYRESEETEVQNVLQARADEVFRDPASPIGGNLNGDVTLVEFFDY